MRAWFAPIPLPAGEQRGEIVLPKVGLKDILTVTGSLKEAGRQLKKLPVSEIARKLHFVANRWRDPNLPERREALNLLPKLLPFSEPACKQAIDALFEPLTVDRMLNLLDELLGSRNALDGFVERTLGLKRRAFGAELAFLVLSGNIVGIGIWDMVFCLLCKTPVLVKPSSEEPVLPSLFAQSLERFAPDLAPAVAVVPFESQREELVDAAIKECDLVIAYGTDETVQAVKRKVPAKVKFVERGHKFSIAVVAEEFADERTADLLALDIARFDQRGCLSPQVCFVVGRNAEVKGREFAQKVAVAFSRIGREIPANLRESEKASVAQFRLTCEMMGADVVASEDAGWTVVQWGGSCPDVWQKVGCAARTVHIVAVESLDKVFETLRPFGKFLQGVAVAVAPEDLEKVAEELGEMGASRVCPVGQLQTPPVEWSQDGKHLISELVRWCDFEPFEPAPREIGWVEVYRGDLEKAITVRQVLEQTGVPVDLENEFDPTNPISPIYTVRVPAQFADEAKQAVADGLNL